MYSPDETFLPKSNLPYVEARVNSKAAQLTENGAEIVCLFARLALGASFISAVADCFGLWGAIWSKERILGRFRSFRGIHGRGDVSLPQFIDGVVCMGSYHRGDTLWDIAHRRLQNTNGLRPLRSSPFVICYGYGHRSWHQDAIRLFGLLGGCSSILTVVPGA
jgi:hypothetical protein